jgi:hypothetical protein
MIIIKGRSGGLYGGVGEWHVYHHSLGNTGGVFK